MKLNKFNISFSTIKPFLLMALFVLCILNAGIVRSDEHRDDAEKITTTHYCSDLNRGGKLLKDNPYITSPATAQAVSEFGAQKVVDYLINYPNP